MVASTVQPLTPKSQDSFRQYYRSIQDLQNVSRGEQRSRFEATDKAYQREVDASKDQQRAAQANATGDTSRMQNLVVPVVMPQVEAAVTHQASVYLTGDPLFGVTSSPQFIDEALQMESILEENSLRGAWARQLVLFFRDGFKHNISYLEVDWDQQVT